MANLEHLEILRQSIEEWNRWRIENRFKMIDLREADLIGAYLDSPPPAEDLRSERVNELRRLHTLSGTRAESQAELPPFGDASQGMLRKMRCCRPCLS